MDPIKLLRQRAADQRDTAVKEAKNQFLQASRLIDELEASLPAEPQEPRRRRGSRKSIIELIADMMPKDRPFTIRELMELLTQAEPERPFHEATVRAIFTRLVDQGMIRKVRKGNSGTVLWAAAGYKIAESPIAALPIMDAIGEVLGQTGPLRPAELVVAMQDRGYRSDAEPRALLRASTHALKRSQGRFTIGDDGRWSAT